MLVVCLLFQETDMMVKIGFAVMVCVVGISLAYPMAEDPTKPADVRQVAPTGRQGGLAAVLGSIGTALVPVFGAVLGPILTNLAQGISTAFNNGLNASTNRTAEAQALLVRIPQDSPLYAALIQGQLITPDIKEGLPSVTNTPATAGKTPFKLGVKFGFGNEPAPVDDAEPVLIHDADVPEPPTSPVKRIPTRKRTETDYL